MRYCKTCCKAGQATDDNTTHAYCMLDTQGYKHTLGIRNTYCLSTAPMVVRTLYVHLSVLLRATETDDNGPLTADA